MTRCWVEGQDWPWRMCWVRNPRVQELVRVRRGVIVAWLLPPRPGRGTTRVTSVARRASGPRAGGRPPQIARAACRLKPGRWPDTMHPDADHPDAKSGTNRISMTG